jgi:phytoene desaturase
VVIGSGFGGLAAAIRLGARGWRVTVLEKLDAPGGRAYVFRQDGFTFDAGPTIVTAPFLFEDLWRLCGRDLADDVELRPLAPFYRIRFNDGETFDSSGDADAVREQVRRLSPGDVAGYDRFMALSAEICKVGFEGLGHVPFLNWTDMAKVVPDMMRLQSWRSVHGLVSRYFRDPRLRIAFGFHPLFIGGNPTRPVSGIYGMIPALEKRWGVHYAIGGTGRLAAGMTQLITGQGNEIRYRTEVTEITVGKGAATGVRLASGETIAADIVVSNADSAWTYRHLVAPEHRRRWTDRKLDAAKYSTSLFVWYFGTDRRYPDVPHHTIALGPRYEGLLDDIFDRHKLAEDFSLYLHHPTASDPSLAPPGCDTFYVLSPVPNLAGGTDWTAQAEPYRARIAAHLEKILLPGLSRHVVTSRMVTPLDFQNRLHGYRGAAFGLEPVLLQSAYFRPHNLSEDVRNLFLVGAGTHPGAGVPGVLSSARILDTVVPHAAAFRRA